MGHEFILLTTMRIEISLVVIYAATLSIRQSTSQRAELDGRTLRDERGVRSEGLVTSIILAIHIDVVVVVPRSSRSLRRRGPLRGIW